MPRPAILPHALLLLFVVSLVALTGNRPACDNRTPDVTCVTDIPITVLPGECVDVDNPCDESGAWSRVDGLLVDEPVKFLYVRPGSLGLGQ